MESWYVVIAKSKSERLASQAIEELGIQTYLPEYVQRIRHARKSHLERRALFPGYLFAKFSLDHPQWPRIFSRRGVNGVICEGQRPKRVPDDQMDLVREIAGDYANVICEAIPLSTGQVVKIIDGAFAAHSAIVKRADETATIDVEVSLFGRATPMTLPRDHVAPVGELSGKISSL